eukprot:765951-Hanusia_phi.AAC.2
MGARCWFLWLNAVSRLTHPRPCVFSDFPCCLPAIQTRGGLETGIPEAGLKVGHETFPAPGTLRPFASIKAFLERDISPS